MRTSLPGLPLDAVPRLIISLLLGAAVGVAVGFSNDVFLGLLAGIAGTELFFVLAGWVVLWPMSAEATRGSACREDLRPLTDELVVVAVALCGLGAIALLLLRGGRSGHGDAAAVTALCGVFL